MNDDIISLLKVLAGGLDKCQRPRAVPLYFEKMVVRIERFAGPGDQGGMKDGSREATERRDTE
jgi:hypothetical protein